MRKKNKRKEPEFKKPFIVLSRSKIAGWLFIIFFVSAWMFVLGILVGRGTAPVKFDVAAPDNEIELPSKEIPGKQGETPVPGDSDTVKDKTKLDFYEALKENTEDTKVPILKKPAEKNMAQKPAQDNSVSSKTEPEKSKAGKAPAAKKPDKKIEEGAAVVKTNTSGPTYTIQAASVKNPKDADRLVQKLTKSGYPAYRAIGKIPGKGVWFRVRIGNYKSKSEAMPTMNKLKKDGLKPLLVLREK